MDKGTAIVYGDDISFPGDYVTYSKEEGMRALTEDIDHAQLNLEGGFVCEAEEDFRYILEMLKKGCYSVDEDAMKSEIAHIETMLKDIEQRKSQERKEE